MRTALPPEARTTCVQGSRGALKDRRPAPPDSDPVPFRAMAGNVSNRFIFPAWPDTFLNVLTSRADPGYKKRIRLGLPGFYY